MADVEESLLAGVPLLLVRPSGSVRALPTVLWVHGYGASKETHLAELHRLADRGLLAVGIDAVAHGRRRPAGFEHRVTGSPGENAAIFRQIVGDTVAGLPRLVDQLLELGLSEPGRLAIAGVSMGGCIVYGAVAADRRYAAAVALLGSPEWTRPEDDGAWLDAFHPTALLSITAARDSVVPPAAARALHARLAGRYRLQPERLRYRELAGAPHLMPAADWATATAHAADWLTRFLP
jgi:dienelactone hydrolase